MIVLLTESFLSDFEILGIFDVPEGIDIKAEIDKARDEMREDPRGKIFPLSDKKEVVEFLRKKFGINEIEYTEEGL